MLIADSTDLMFSCFLMDVIVLCANLLGSV